MSDLFEGQLGEPSVLQHVLALGGRGVTDLQEQVVGVEATVLTDALLRLQHPRAHVRLAGAQLELLLAPMGEETQMNLDWSLHSFTFTTLTAEILYLIRFLFFRSLVWLVVIILLKGAQT